MYINREMFTEKEFHEVDNAICYGKEEDTVIGGIVVGKLSIDIIAEGCFDGHSRIFFNVYIGAGEYGDDEISVDNGYVNAGGDELLSINTLESVSSCDDFINKLIEAIEEYSATSGYLSSDGLTLKEMMEFEKPEEFSNPPLK